MHRYLLFLTFFFLFVNSMYGGTASIEEGNEYLEREEYDKAISIFEKVVAQSVDAETSAVASTKLAECYICKGDYTKAKEILNEVLKRYPGIEGLPSAMLHLAFAYRERGALGEAKVLLKQINENFPNTEIGQFALGIYYEDEGEWEKAIEMYKAVIEFKGSQRLFALFQLGECFYLLGEYDSALNAFQQLLKECNNKFEKSTQTKMFIAWCYEHQFNFSSAIDYYFSLLKNLPPDQSTPFKIRIGYCYLQLGNYQRAMQVWDEIIRTSPYHDEWYYLAKRLKENYESKIKPDIGTPLRKEGESSKLIGFIDQVHNDFQADFRKGKVLIIYGRESDDVEQNAASFLSARELKNLFEKKWGFNLPCREASTLTPEELKDNDLYIFGNPQTNEVLASLLPSLPIKIGENRIEVANRVYEGEDIGVIMLAPNPYNKDKFLLVYCAFAPFLQWGCRNVFHGQADYHIFSKEALQGRASSPVLEEGFFLKIDPTKWEAIPSRKEVQ